VKIDAENLRSLRGKGCVYAARTGNRRWIKIGFSSHITSRLNALDYSFPQYAPFIPLGACRSSWRAEQQIHRALRSLHVEGCREIYPAIKPIEQVAEALVAGEYLPHFDIDEFCSLKDWAKRLSAHLRGIS
jgi:hypothetical protein